MPEVSASRPTSKATLASRAAMGHEGASVGSEFELGYDQAAGAVTTLDKTKQSATFNTADFLQQQSTYSAPGQAVPL